MGEDSPFEKCLLQIHLCLLGFLYVLGGMLSKKYGKLVNLHCEKVRQASY